MTRITLGQAGGALLLTAALGRCALAGAASVTVTVVDTEGAPLENAVVTVRAAGAGAGGASGRMSPQTAGRLPAHTGGPKPTQTIAQVNQQFDPRVTVIRRGTRVRFPNTDITQHHVYSFSEAKRFELELYSGDDFDPVLFDRRGIVALGCNIHDWMLGYVYVTDAEHFGVSDTGGRVELDADSGAIDRLTVWHPGAVRNAPADFDLSALPVREDGTYQVTVETPPPDPLEFEIDPLQSLFPSSAP